MCIINSLHSKSSNKVKNIIKVNSSVFSSAFFPKIPNTVRTNEADVRRGERNISFYQ